MKKVVLKVSQIHSKTLVPESFLIKLPALVQQRIKREVCHGCFPGNF